MISCVREYDDERPFLGMKVDTCFVLEQYL